MSVTINVQVRSIMSWLPGFFIIVEVEMQRIVCILALTLSLKTIRHGSLMATVAENRSCMYMVTGRFS